MAGQPLKILLEMRPALDGHAGIPQETRLLFRGLSLLDGLSVEGLIQSSGHVLAPGLPARGDALSADRRLNRLSRVVISIQQEVSSPLLHSVLMGTRHLLGQSETLTRFDPTHFRDFIWRRLFARTLPPEDFEAVTRARFRIARVPWAVMHRTALVWRHVGYPLYPRLDTSDFDVMIAETPFPARVSRNTQMIVRYHDAIPLLLPHTISDRPFHQASHYHALRCNVESGAWFACVSEATRADLLAIFPQAEPRTVTIHNMVSHHYHDEDSPHARVPEVIWNRLHDGVYAPHGEAPKPDLRARVDSGERLDYLLIVSTIEPRKNHITLLRAWEQLRATRFPALKLVVVGMLGWDHEAIIRKFRPWIDRGDCFVLEDVPSSELRLLYKHARATVCPSIGEGFDFSGVEAMMCGGAVVASDIAVHREVFADAAEYFSAYSAEDLADAAARVIDPGQPGRRDELVHLGAGVSQRYTPEAILPRWRDFLVTKARGSGVPYVSSDASWQAWGERDPYYGVITNPKFRRGAMTEDARREFFESGREHAKHVFDMVRLHVDPDFRPTTVLDFGCGVGRMLIPFAAMAPRVTGADVAASMLEEARRNCEAEGVRNATLVVADDRLSGLDGPFDLVHSFIVFQHIAPERGRELFRRLLERIAPGGAGAFHFTYSKSFYAATHGMPPPSPPTAPGAAPKAAPDAPPPDPDMDMHPYVMNEILFLMQGAGVHRFHAQYTDHGGALGVLLFFRKPPATP